MARNRYTFFATIAQKNGFEQIAAIFREAANNKHEHANRFFSLLKGEGAPVQVQCGVCAAPLGKTPANLRSAAEIELEEHSQTYPHWAAIAEQEGFDEIARVWRALASVGREHEQQFRVLLTKVEEETVFIREEAVIWKCRSCGHCVSARPQAPDSCPVCGQPQGFYEVKEVLE
jgi:rubrerythrin